jgi:hypothetical protein
MRGYCNGGCPPIIPTYVVKIFSHRTVGYLVAIHSFFLFSSSISSFAVPETLQPHSPHSPLKPTATQSLQRATKIVSRPDHRELSCCAIVGLSSSGTARAWSPPITPSKYHSQQLSVENGTNQLCRQAYWHEKTSVVKIEFPRSSSQKDQKRTLFGRIGAS